MAPAGRTRSIEVAQPEEVGVIPSIESEFRQDVATRTIPQNSISKLLTGKPVPPALDSREDTDVSLRVFPGLGFRANQKSRVAVRIDAGR